MSMQQVQTQEYISQLQEQLAQAESDRFVNSRQQVSSMFGSRGEENLIKFQLDLSEEMERIEHLLRGDKLIRDDNGSEIYVAQDDEDLKPFNESGVQTLLKVVSFYLNRNTILSYYQEKQINFKMKDLSDEITDLIFMKYEKMGMDTKEKRKLYPMIVRELVDTVHSAYLRALLGGERESLRTARTVNQTEPINNQMMYPHSAGIQRRGNMLTRLFRP